MNAIRLKPFLLAAFFSIATALAAETPPTVGATVNVDPALVAPTQTGYGSAEVTLDLQKWAKDPKTGSELVTKLAKEFADPVPGFYGPAVSAAAGEHAKDVFYITDGHHHAAALYRLLYEYDELPDDVKKLLTPAQQEALRADPRFRVHVTVSKVYDSQDAVLVHMAKHTETGLPESVTSDPAFKKALKNATTADRPDEADLKILRKAFGQLPATIKGLTDDPIRSVMGVFFKSNDLKGSLLVDRIQFLLADKLSKKGFVIDTDYKNLAKTLKDLDKAVFDDPAIMKFLEDSARAGAAVKNAAQLKTARDAYVAGTPATHIDLQKLIRAVCK